VAKKYGMLGRDKEYSFVETLQSVGGFFVTTGLFFVLYIYIYIYIEVTTIRNHQGYRFPLQ